MTYIHGGYKYRSPFGHLSDDDFTAACVGDLRDLLAIATAGDVACMIAEPIQGVGGFVVPPDGFFGAMKEVLDEHGILFIDDEVQTGWGRTGEHFWGIEAHGVVPDMITFAKGLGNGLSMGGVIARAEIMDCVTANHISTFGGNPLSTAGALANLDYLITHDLQENAHKVGQQLRNDLDRLATEVPEIGEVRGKGLMLGVELVEAGSKTPGRRHGDQGPRGGPGRGAAHRQGRAVRQRAAHRPAAEPHRRRGHRGLHQAGDGGLGGAGDVASAAECPSPRRSPTNREPATTPAG